MLDRVAIFYSMPRSGSTPLSRALAHYFAETHGHIYLDEFYNHEFYSVANDRGKLSCTADPIPGPLPPVRKYTVEQSSVRVQERHNELLESLNASDFKYCLKMFPDNDCFLGNEFKALAEQSQFIFIVRRNIFEHCLSFLLSFATFQFYRPGGLRFEAGSILGRKDHFQDFIFFLARIKRRMNELPAAPVLYYEDFVDAGPAAVLQSAGFKEEIDWTDFENTEKQNAGGKLGLFKNPGEIVSWYRNSSLHELFPIHEDGGSPEL